MTIAVVSFKQLGDILMLEPLMRLLAARSGEPVHFFGRRNFAPLVGLMSSAIPKIWTPRTYDHLYATHEGTKATRRAATLLAREKTVFVVRQKSVRWEHRLVYGRIVTVDSGQRYMARYFFEEVGGERTGFTPPALRQPPAAWRPAKLGLPERYLLVHPTAAWRDKYWTAEGWAAVIDRLQERQGLPVVLSGGPTAMERRHRAAIMERCARKPIEAAGQTTIAEYVWLIANATGLVAIDGSACHLADAFGIPAVKLFGRTSEFSWFNPRPDAWLIVSGPGGTYERPAAKEIPVAVVMEAVDAMLARIGGVPGDARDRVIS